MIEEAPVIETSDGVADAVLLRPGTGASGAGVIHLTDIRGLRDSQRRMAARLVAQGFVVLIPNVFYRTAVPPVIDFPFAAGEARSMKRMQELVAPLTPDAMDRDMATYVDYLASHPAVRRGPLGIVGYCATGKMALHGAAVRSGIVAAAASFHGGGLATDDPSSPHRLLPRVKAALYFGHAEGDRSMPPEAIATLEAALAGWGGDYASELYEGAHHGWTVPDHAAFNAPQAERAFDKLSALLAKQLRERQS
jgi:carboxymethylenebutenolidase